VAAAGHPVIAVAAAALVCCDCGWDLVELRVASTVARWLQVSGLLLS